MVRGVNKKMVEVVEMDHEYFERAILIVRPPQQNREEPLLGQEASRYIKNLRYRPSGRRQLPAGALMAVRLGAAAAAGAGLMAYQDFKPGVTPASRLTEDYVSEVVES